MAASLPVSTPSLAQPRTPLSLCVTYACPPTFSHPLILRSRLTHRTLTTWAVSSLAGMPFHFGQIETQRRRREHQEARWVGKSTLFAAVTTVTRGGPNTPLTVVAAGMAKWLDIYSGVLMVRVLLSWFPNIPWDRQPLSAIRDLCDPYLNLFRNIIPPIFDTLDVSPLLAFSVLGTLATILNATLGVS